MKLKSMKYLFLLMMSVLALTSCSEDSTDDSDEYANWQARNDQAFADTLALARQQGADQGWDVLLKWSLKDQTANKDVASALPSYSDDNYVVVKKLANGTGSAVQLLLTDSVEVCYQGRLMPSASYSKGAIFDGTFAGDYNPNTALTSKFLVGGLIDGFTTALLEMKNVGDHWKVFIPYNLGYGSSTSNSSIPAYSMLRFEIVLKGYWHDGKWDKK